MMDTQARRALSVVRRISQAGLADCQRAIKASGGDICLALRDLMSDEQIRIAIADRRIRENDPARPLTGAFAAQEGEILARLDAMLRFQKRESRESRVIPSKPLDLPDSFGSYDELVDFIQRTIRTVPEHDGFVAACKQRGIAEADIGYILDRIAGGAFRAWMAQAGATGGAPDRDSDPVAHAVYTAQSRARRWWQFWKR